MPPVSTAQGELVANLPPVSTAQGELVAKFAAGVVDTGGKLAAGVVDTGGNMPLLSLTPVACLGAWGKVIHEKNPIQKIS